MTSLLAPRRPRPEDRADAAAVRLRRPMALIATLGGVAAALAPLVVLLALGVVGWFLSDVGVHGAPRDGMRVGAVVWLMAHGSTVTVQGAVLTVVPLGVTALCGWSTWRVGHRVGDLVSGHGPDADRIADGERDWTVPTAVLLFFCGYAVTVIVTATLATGDATGPAPSLPRVLVGAGLLTGLLAAPAIATGSGRAAIWATFVPEAVRAGFRTALSVLAAYLAVSTVLWVVSLAADAGEAATMVSRLHLGAGEAILYVLADAALWPNATGFAASFLLGPGFMVGAGTLVSPGAVVLGPLPLLPLLAALPAPGATSGWVAALVAVPPTVAAVATWRVQRRLPTVRYDHAALRGCGGGIAAGVALAVFAALSGGAAGPGRLAHVGPPVGEVLVHAITAFGLGGLVAGLAATWWQRRSAQAQES